jgi:hypothetical protein
LKEQSKRFDIIFMSLRYVTWFDYESIEGLHNWVKDMHIGRACLVLFVGVPMEFYLKMVSWEYFGVLDRNGQLLTIEEKFVVDDIINSRKRQSELESGSGGISTGKKSFN